MNPRAPGSIFEREICEQPGVWEALAAGDHAARLAGALRGSNIVLVGSGSSLFVAQLGALALRRRGIQAHALPATEARLDHVAYEGCTVVAISQSGRSSDLLKALDILAPRKLLALTNTRDSPLGQRADEIFDIGAGEERAVPASKSVSATAALLLWSASLLGGNTNRNAAVLRRTSQSVRLWLESDGTADVKTAARVLANRSSAVVLGSDYGLPIAMETALKLKEAAYLHAEGFAAGEFRHGSIAMVDANYAAIGIVDADGFDIVSQPLRELAGVANGNVALYTIGSVDVPTIKRLGPNVEEPFNTLAWLVTAQLLALHTARAKNLNSDTPRGLRKALTTELH